MAESKEVRPEISPVSEPEIIKGKELQGLVKFLKNIKKAREISIGAFLKPPPMTGVIGVRTVEDSNKVDFYSFYIPGASPYLPPLNFDREIKKSREMVIDFKLPDPQINGSFVLEPEEYAKILGFSEAALSWNDGVKMSPVSNSLKLRRVCEHPKLCPLGKKSLVRKGLENIRISHS